MRILRTLSVITITLSIAWSMSIETTTTRSPKPTQATPKTNDSAKNTTNHMESNISTQTILDVRTPPKIQTQIKDRLSSKYHVEASHAGEAIPIAEDDIVMLEESTKKMNFYKLDRATTANGGLSTWILLSGQSSTTPKPTTKRPTIKPIILKDEKNNETLMLSDKPIGVVKPIFKQKVSTTAKPTTTSTTIRINTFSPKSTTVRSPTKVTKIKASLINNSKNNNTKISNHTIIKTISTTTPSKIITTSLPPMTTALESTTKSTKNSSATLPVEAKDGTLDLSSNQDKKKKTQKRKKNKTKKRKPSTKENNNKLKEIESTGTQIYSYLKSEIIPVTVGVSLVGLLVTAGLASYYLQPFAALRRSDPIDRKDTGNYFYRDEYSNAMPEEEAIGKVIAGMPESTLQPNAFKGPSSRNTYPQNIRYRHVDRRSQLYMKPYGSVEDVKLHDRTATINKNDEKKFVVGNVPKEAIQEVTPAVVPEHGPRTIKNEPGFILENMLKSSSLSGASPRYIGSRRRRQINEQNDLENEVDSGDSVVQMGTTSASDNETLLDVTNATTESNNKDTTPHNVYNPNERPNTFFELLADLFRLKLKFGSDLIHDIVSSVETYVNATRSMLVEHYNRHNHTAEST
ncbi:uncharacterized protein LOC126741291 [Anthonomus grandis grandis]|uniref:uncharacterized protein LOC126741291 n=1 Tax=Anthonomus grandis grandis TaxID=2921223 RepID=UPI002165B6B3|nr:uncharacterized protein LOC126741291 [Anthonomus grandis grandis]